MGWKPFPRASKLQTTHFQIGSQVSGCWQLLGHAATSMWFCKEFMLLSKVPQENTKRESLFWNSTPSPCKNKGTVYDSHSFSKVMGWSFRRSSPVALTPSQNSSSSPFPRWHISSKNSRWSFPRPAKTRWGRKIAASSFVSLEILGSIQLTDTWKGSGMVICLQNLCMICLCTLPFWDPQFPVFAKATNSTWSALSCRAKSASSLTSMALSMPCAHRESNLVASWDSLSGSAGAFPKAFLWSMPDSFSSSQPLSLLHV